MRLIQLMAVGSGHKDAPDVSLSVPASSGPTSLKSQVTELFYTKRSHDLLHMYMIMSLVMSSHLKMMLHCHDVRI